MAKTPSNKNARKPIKKKVFNLSVYKKKENLEYIGSLHVVDEVNTVQ